MAPEAHGAQVLPDPDYGPKNMICSTKTVLPYNFGFIKFLPSLTDEAVDAPQTLFRAPLTPGVRVQGWNLAKNLSAIKIYSYAKFHQGQSDGLDFYRVRIYIVLYILDWDWNSTRWAEHQTNWDTNTENLRKSQVSLMPETWTWILRTFYKMLFLIQGFPEVLRHPKHVGPEWIKKNFRFGHFCIK
jgi:hypothetical protein